MSHAAIHTVPHGDQWANKHEGASKVIKTFVTKEKAVEAGRAEAMREKVEHVIHNLDGKVGERHRYGDSHSASKG